MQAAAPVIPWMGGKRRLADKLIPLFPQHECYVEVFCGGGALYFLRPVPAKVEVINDYNFDLVCLYRVLQNHLQEFIRQFEFAIVSRQIFEWEKMTRPETLTDIQRAARFYYLQQLAFAGKVSGQNYGTVTEGSGFDITRIGESLTAAWRRLGGTNIENLAWQDCIKRYDRPHTFFYCDPPYWQTEGYGVPFEFENYERMASFMKTCKGKVMVSINDHPDIRRAYEGLIILDGEMLGIKYSVANTHGNPDTSRELVILNYDPMQVGGLF
jgi:DNA adenine methylase